MIKKLSLLLFFTFLALAQLNAGHRRIGVAMASNYVGDREVAWRVKIAGESLGWEVFVDETEGRQLQSMDLDWVICMLANNDYLHPSCPNYLTIYHPFWFLDEERRLMPFCEKYDGYLLTINDRESIAQGLHLKGKDFNYVRFYPTVNSFPYCEVSLDNLVTMIPVWSNRLTDEKFRNVYRLLSQTGKVKFYGVHRNEDIISQGYMGPIPFDGVSVINVLQKHGIVLVIHSDIHNLECIPTPRIFEAAAASAVIISDENTFVKENFGDSVFYIDTNKNFMDIFFQIQKHMQTIQSNPKKALEMAKTAHEIFIENFEMSDQLLEIDEMNQRIIK